MRGVRGLRVEMAWANSGNRSVVSFLHLFAPQRQRQQEELLSCAAILSYFRTPISFLGSRSDACDACHPRDGGSPFDRS